MKSEKLIYSWRHKFLGKGIDPRSAERELKRIKKLYGKLTPKILLDASRSKKALFHSFFEWNNNIAAEKFRLQQARVLINNIQVTIVRSGSDIVDVPVYEVVKDKRGRNNYVDVSEIISNADNMLIVKSRAKRELLYWKTKYETYDSLSRAIEKIQPVLELL